MSSRVRPHLLIGLLGAAGSVAGVAGWGAADALTSARAGAASFEELVVISCAALAWAGCVWIASVVALVAVTAAPGVAGRIAARWSAALVPGLARHAVRSALGFAALAAPIAASAPMAASTPVAAASPVAAVPVSAMHIAGAHAVATGESSPRPLPDVGRPPVRPPGDAAQVTDPPDHAPAGDTAVLITVEPGDSLWAIAEHHLGPRATDHRIAAEWPRWFAANRDEIGPDPDHIVPGTMLRAPPAHDAPA
ncbi:MAG TPA: hypothetical protein VIP77_25725 [Jiangellaceae bacterium]